MTDWEFHCQIVGVLPTASLDEIKHAFREAAKILHPDKHGNSDASKKRFQQLQDSYEYLLSHAPVGVQNDAPHSHSNHDGPATEEQVQRKLSRIGLLFVLIFGVLAVLAVIKAKKKTYVLDFNKCTIHNPGVYDGKSNAPRYKLICVDSGNRGFFTLGDKNNTPIPAPPPGFTEDVGENENPDAAPTTTGEIYKCTVDFYNGQPSLKISALWPDGGYKSPWLYMPPLVPAFDDTAAQGSLDISCDNLGDKACRSQDDVNPQSSDMFYQIDCTGAYR